MPKTQRQRAEAILAMTRPYTADQVREAFREKVKTSHPDTGGAGIDGAILRNARDLLLRYADGSGLTKCSACGGTGWTKGRGFHPKECAPCGGTGERREP